MNHQVKYFCLMEGHISLTEAWVRYRNGRGSADRYFQEEVTNSEKFVPEGVEGRVPYRGPVEKVIEQLTGGVRASMGYTGNKNIKDFKKNTKLVRITSAGLNESHVHGISITRESPNYQTNK